MLDLLLVIGLIGLIIALWVCIWHVGIILVPVGFIMTYICVSLIKEI